MNQQQRLAEIEDKVVHYEKKILENEQKIYLWLALLLLINEYMNLDLNPIEKHKS